MTYVHEVLRVMTERDVPMNNDDVGKVLGIDARTVGRAMQALRDQGKVVLGPGQKAGYPNQKFMVFKVDRSKMHGNVLTSPAWVPPKSMHRPVYEAPGCTLREFITGRSLT